MLTKRPFCPSSKNKKGTATFAVGRLLNMTRIARMENVLAELQACSVAEGGDPTFFRQWTNVDRAVKVASNEGDFEFIVLEVFRQFYCHPLYSGSLQGYRLGVSVSTDCQQPNPLRRHRLSRV